MKKKDEVRELMKKENIKNKVPDLIYMGNDAPFTTISNQALFDPNITLKAKGLLAILLSNKGKDGWKTYESAILKLYNGEISMLRTGLTELEENSYLIRIRYRKNGKRAGVMFIYSDDPNNLNVDVACNLITTHGFTPEFSNSKKPNIRKPNIRKPNIRKTTTNKNNIKEEVIETRNKNNIVEDVADAPHTATKRTNKKKTISPKYIKVANKLAKVIKIRHDINVPKIKITKWADELRKLDAIDGVNVKRQKAAIKWYKKAVDSGFVIQSASALRKKIVNVESAMNRKDFSKQPKKDYDYTYKNKDYEYDNYHKKANKL